MGISSSNRSNNKKVIFKEMLVPILESYINQIDQELKEMNCLTELYLIELCGIPIFLRVYSSDDHQIF